jgi:hypothetical protein
LNLPNAYFRANDDKLTSPYKRKTFVALECELQGLDNEAWEFLKGEALPRLRSRHPTRGWHQLFDTLNEAKGYNHLVRIDCKSVRFIPRSKIDKIQTPDIRGLLGANPILCEVKTTRASASHESTPTRGVTAEARQEHWVNIIHAEDMEV